MYYEAYASNPVLDLNIYNLLGQKVATIVSEQQLAGSYKVEWDASGLSGGTPGFASGVYIYQLKANRKEKSSVFTKKLVLLK